MKCKLFFLSALLLLSVSCDRIFINGELDGMWKLDKVSCGDSIVYPQKICWSFQRHIAMLGVYYDDGFPDYCMADFNYDANELTMTTFYRYPGNGIACGIEELKKYHIYSDTVVLTVDYIDSERLLMRTGEYSYSFSKW